MGAGSTIVSKVYESDWMGNPPVILKKKPTTHKMTCGLCGNEIKPGIDHYKRGKLIRCEKHKDN